MTVPSVLVLLFASSSSARVAPKRAFASSWSLFASFARKPVTPAVMRPAAVTPQPTNAGTFQGLVAATAGRS